MSTYYVIVGEDPPIGFWYGEASYFLPDIHYARLVSLPIWRAPVYVDGGAENANGTITLANGDGVLSALFSDPPLRERVQAWVDETLLIDGVITEVVVSDDVLISFEA